MYQMYHNIIVNKNSMMLSTIWGAKHDSKALLTY